MFVVLARHWWTLALRGLVAILFGVMAFAWPRITLTILVLLFGAYALVDGVFAIVAAVSAPKELRRWWMLLIEGLISVGIGGLSFVWPGITALALLWLIAFWAVLTGIFEIGTAIQLRKVIEGEWLLILSGILSILFGLLLVVVPGAGALAVIWIIGLYAVIFGVLLVALAFRMRRFRNTIMGDALGEV
jgi:uncharacterized membrane protein HdeD (DUF308 family)